MWFLKLALGATIGAFIGAILGIALAMGIGMYAAATNPDDPTAGSVAIVVIFTLPQGFILGGILGAALTYRWTLKADSRRTAAERLARSLARAEGNALKSSQDSIEVH